MLIVLLWALATLMAAFSTATALVTKDISSFAAIINGMNLPLLLLSGVLLADRAGAAVAERPGPFQPALLPGRRLSRPGCRPPGRLGRLAGVCRADTPMRARTDMGDPGLPPGRVLTNHPHSGIAFTGHPPDWRDSVRPPWNVRQVHYREKTG